jgi:hypothetical protein
MKRVLFVLFVAGLAAGAACSLNPQPLPPESSFAADDGGHVGEGGGSSAGDLGAGAGDGSTKQGGGASDATTVPPGVVDAGLDGANDGPNDAPSDALSDSPDDT